jgi:hypothetical protein
MCNILFSMKSFFLFQTVKVLIFMAVFYALSWLPLHVISVMGSSNTELMNQEFLPVLWMFSHWFAFTNCTAQPINYFVMNKDFRRKAKKLLWKICCCGKEPNTQPYSRSSLTMRNSTRSSMRENFETKI